MPSSQDFRDRLSRVLPLLKGETPCYVYDEIGIRSTAQRLIAAFAGCPNGFREFFAVKACPNKRILKIMKEYGFGFDCASETELEQVKQVGARGGDIMFTSNNTSRREFAIAVKRGVWLNLDDESFVKKVPEPFPKHICLRYNPGDRRTRVESSKGRVSSQADFNPIGQNYEEAKFGLTHQQMVPAYRAALERGAQYCSLHSMIASNERRPQFFVDTMEMLLSVATLLHRKLGIKLERINIGGGLGIPYRPEDEELPIEWIAKEVTKLLLSFQRKQKFCPTLLMESGRFMTGPHGVLVTKCINRMRKYKEFVGVDACMSSLMRPGMYGAYHHILVYTPDGTLCGESILEKVDVVGSLCEGNDRFAIDRLLPCVREGYFVVIESAGAHGYAMTFNYNGRLRPPEWLLCPDISLKLIRRGQTIKDYLATETFKQRILR